jgi:hypothetical protein
MSGMVARSIAGIQSIVTGSDNCRKFFFVNHVVARISRYPDDFPVKRGNVLALRLEDAMLNKQRLVSVTCLPCLWFHKRLLGNAKAICLLASEGFIIGARFAAFHRN